MQKYSGDLNIVIIKFICTLLFYAINMNVVNLFTDTSFLFLTTLDLYCIDYYINFNE